MKVYEEYFPTHCKYYPHIVNLTEVRWEYFTCLKAYLQNSVTNVQSLDQKSVKSLSSLKDNLIIRPALGGGGRGGRGEEKGECLHKSFDKCLPPLDSMMHITKNSNQSKSLLVFQLSPGKFSITYGNFKNKLDLCALQRFACANSNKMH